MDAKSRFEQMYRAHASTVETYARRRSDVQTADEVTADVFLVAWRRIDQVPEELSSVTRRTRRVARFAPGVVRAAIEVNKPTRIFLNHIDYVDGSCAAGPITDTARDFIESVESSIGAGIDMVGIGPGPGDLISPRHRVGPATS